MYQIIDESEHSDIVMKYATGIKATELSREYGVTVGRIYDIIRPYRKALALPTRFGPTSENSSNVKIDTNTALMIISLKGKYTSEQVAERLPISAAMVRKIWQGKSWKNAWKMYKSNR